jgi:hypothetical protein
MSSLQLMSSRARFSLAILGAVVFASAGGIVGAANAGWIQFNQEGNDFLPFLGLGAGLVVVAFWGSRFATEMTSTAIGKAAAVLLILGPALYVVSWLIDFAIFGTLTLFLGLACLSVAVFAHQLATTFDRVLIALSAVGSITWNTETSSALLLLGVALIWIVLAARLLLAVGDQPLR